MARAVGILLAATLMAALCAADRSAPFVPTNGAIIDVMLELLDPRPGDTFVDLGSGDGRIVNQVALKYGVRRAVGYEIDSELVSFARNAASHAGLNSSSVEFIQGDIFEADLSQFSLVSIYLTPAVMDKLATHLLHQLKPGTRIVCHDYGFHSHFNPDFAFSGHHESKVQVTGSTGFSVFLYHVPDPAQAPRSWTSFGAEFVRGWRDQGALYSMSTHLCLGSHNNLCVDLNLEGTNSTYHRLAVHGIDQRLVKDAQVLIYNDSSDTPMNTINLNSASFALQELTPPVPVGERMRIALVSTKRTGDTFDKEHHDFEGHRTLTAKARVSGFKKLLADGKPYDVDSTLPALYSFTVQYAATSGDLTVTAARRTSVFPESHVTVSAAGGGHHVSTELHTEYLAGGHGQHAVKSGGTLNVANISDDADLLLEVRTTERSRSNEALLFVDNVEALLAAAAKAPASLRSVGRRGAAFAATLSNDALVLQGKGAKNILVLGYDGRHRLVFAFECATEGAVDECRSPVNALTALRRPVRGNVLTVSVMYDNA